MTQLGDIVENEREQGVTRKEFRQFKRNIRQMRRNSESFNNMYEDMRNSKDKFVFKAAISTAGGKTDRPWDKGQDGVTTMNINVRMSENKETQTIAHEAGHGWRIAEKLDQQVNKLAGPTMPGLMSTKQDWNNYNKQNDFVKGQNNLSQANANQAAEIGAMHIENIVSSELKASGNVSFSSLELKSEYSSTSAITATPGISIYGNPTYNLNFYQTYFNIVPLSYYNNKLDIYQEHGVKPIK